MSSFFGLVFVCDESGVDWVFDDVVIASWSDSCGFADFFIVCAVVCHGEDFLDLFSSCWVNDDVAFEFLWKAEVSLSIRGVFDVAEWRAVLVDAFFE